MNRRACDNDIAVWSKKNSMTTFRSIHDLCKNFCNWSKNFDFFNA